MGVRVNDAVPRHGEAAETVRPGLLLCLSELGVRDFCLEKELPYVELDPNWYTFDRFHLKNRACTPYWQSLLQSFPEKHAFSSNWSWAARRPLFPKKYWLVGRERTGHEKYRDLVPHSTTRVR